jgi:hypothetical protein
VLTPCQPAEKGAAGFKNETKSDAQLNLQGIIYFSSEQPNTLPGPNAGEDGNRLSLCNILYIL